VYVVSQSQGPTVTTLVPPSPLASIFSDSLGASPVTQPGQTDGFGHYFFYAPAGLYTVIIVIGGQVYQVLPDQNLGNGGLNVSVTGTPVAGQALVATGPTTASWQAIFGSTINYPAITNQFLNSYNSVTGLFTSAQPVLSGIGNPTSNVNFIFNANTFTRTYSQSSALGNEVLANSNAATVFGNVTSPTLSFAGAVWNGSTSVTDSWNLSLVTGGGPNPTSNFTFQHIGSSGVGSVLVPNLITTNLSIGRIIYDNNGQSGNTGQVLTSTTLGAIWQNSPAVTTLNGSGATFVTGTPGNYTITTLVSGSSTTAVSANANVSTAPTGDIFVSDGNGNLQDSGVSIDSVSVAAVVLSPSANQTIASFSLLPAPGNKTQSLGSASAPWNAYLNILNGGTTIYLTGATDPYSGLISAALAALPSGGGTIDARAAGVAAVAQGTITPIAGVTILLGPYTYTFTKITLADSFQIIGAGAQNCVIQASATTSVALFVGPGATGATITNCRFEGFSVWGPDGGSSTPANYNSLHGFFLDASGAASSAFGGVWSSVWRQISFGGFGGTDIYMKGNLGIHQYNSFYDISAFTNRGVTTAFTLTGTAGAASGGVTVYNGTITGGAANAFAGVTFVVIDFVANSGANNGTFLATASTATTLTLANASGVAETHAGTATGIGSGQAVRIEGTNYQHNFYNVSMQGPNGNSSIDGTSGNNPLLFIGGGATTTAFPYGMQFYGCNINGRYILVQVDGGQDILIEKTHSEQALYFMNVTSGATGSPLSVAGVVVRDCSFNANVGINSGNGSILYFDPSSVGHVNGVLFENNLWDADGGAPAGPDNWVLQSPGAPQCIMAKNWTFGSGLLLQAGAGGQPATVVAAKHLTGQTTSIGATAWFTPVASGLYRVSGSVQTTTAGSGGTVTWGMTYTNRHGAASQNPVSGTASLNTAGFESYGTATVYCTAGDVVSYEATVAGSTGSPVWALDLIAEYLG
jgi:hypothetical protein